MAKTTEKNTRAFDHIMIGQRITEKAALKTSENVYTFNVALDANKIEIKKAIQAIYKVTPLKIATVRARPTEKFIRGKMGTVKAYKKAMVTLKKGDSIEL